MMSMYKKTRAMNVIGAAGLFILGIALFVNKINELPAGGLAAIVGMYAVLAFIPAGTAIALSNSERTKLQKFMLGANWANIALWCLMAVTVIVFHQPLGMAIGSALFFVLPAAINIRALRSMRRGKASQVATEA